MSESQLNILSMLIIAIGGLLITIVIIINWLSIDMDGKFGLMQNLLTFVGSLILLLGLSLYTFIRVGWTRMRLMSVPVAALSISVTSNLFENDTAKLTQQIIQEFPEFTGLQIDNWRKVNILRRWGYRHITRSSRTCLLDKQESFQFYKKNVVERFEAFSQDKGGVFCGGTASTLMELYRLFGFESYTVNMGQVGVSTHVTTLVKINYQGEYVLTVQDAYYNATYCHSTGRPYDYFELLKILKSHAHNQIKVFSGSLNDETEYIFCPDENENWMFNGKSRQQVPCKHISGGRLKCRVRPSLEVLEEHFFKMPLIREFLFNDGHPPEYIYLFLYPFSVNDSVGSARNLLDQAKTIINV